MVQVGVLRNPEDAIYRMKLTLEDAKPDGWRLIDVPKAYTFWDLGVAVRDAMGWLDCHLHAFEPPEDVNATSIGMPEHPGDELYEAG